MTIKTAGETTVKKLALRIALVLMIVGTAVFSTGCATEFGRACTRFVTPA